MANNVVVGGGGVSPVGAPLPRFNLMDYGAKGDGLSNDQAILVSVLAKIGASRSQIVVTKNHNFATGGTVTIPANVSVVFEGGQFLCLGGASAVVFAGPVQARLEKIFGTTAGFSFAAGAVSEVWPEWWGAVGDGVTDDHTALQSALTSVRSGNNYAENAVLRLGARQYKNSAPLILPAGALVQGSGRGSTRLLHSGANACLTTERISSRSYNLGLRDFDIILLSNAGLGFEGFEQLGAKLERLYIEGTAAAANTNRGVRFWSTTFDSFYNLCQSVWTNHCLIGFEVDGQGAGLPATSHMFVDCQAYGDRTNGTVGSRGWQLGPNCSGPIAIVGGYVENAEYGVHTQGAIVHVSGNWEAELCTAKIRFAAGSPGQSVVQGYNILPADISDASAAGTNKIFYVSAISSPAIAFPATSVPSADPNTLDDYEEGTWVPFITRTTTATVTTYTTQVGRYTKIGRLVHVTCSITIGAISTAGTGYNAIGGLPFAPAADSVGSAIFRAALAATPVSNVNVSIANQIYPVGPTLAGVDPAENWVNGGNIQISATYTTAA